MTEAILETWKNWEEWMKDRVPEGGCRPALAACAQIRSMVGLDWYPETTMVSRDTLADTAEIRMRWETQMHVLDVTTCAAGIEKWAFTDKRRELGWSEVMNPCADDAEDRKPSKDFWEAVALMGYDKRWYG